VVTTPDGGIVSDRFAGGQWGSPRELAPPLLPYATLEPVRELLLQQFMGEKFGGDSMAELERNYRGYMETIAQ